YRLSRGAEGQAGVVRSRLLAPDRVRHPQRDRHRGRQADAHHRDRRGPAARGPGGREHPRDAEARSVQAERRAVHGRSAEEEGWEDRSVTMRIKTKDDRRQRIKYRIRARVRGNEARPRLTVFRSVAHIYVQVVDDMSGKTIASA